MWHRALRQITYRRNIADVISAEKALNLNPLTYEQKLRCTQKKNVC